jgi:hypothetical protein
MLGYGNDRHASLPSTTDDIQALYHFFLRCGIFCAPQEVRLLNDMSFAEHAIVESFENSLAREKINQMGNISFTDEEVNMLVAFRTTEYHAELDDECLDKNDALNNMIMNDEDDDLSVNSSSSIVQDERNIGKTKINMMGLINLFDVASDSFQQAVAKRLAANAELKAWERTIESSVEYFQKKQERKMTLLKERHEKRQERVSRDETDTELLINKSRDEYIDG